MTPSTFRCSSAPLIALILAAALPGPALAQNTSEPTWKIPPRFSSDDYPRAALRSNMTGLAAVRCAVTPNGRPSACVIESETPSGYGFGQAAIRVVMRARLNPETIRTEDVGTTFVVTVPFGR